MTRSSVADVLALRRIVLLFVAVTAVGFGLNVWSGLRYTHVSADILFDMRLVLYRHLQRLSPRFYARTRFGDIMSRLNNDIGEIQRVAAEVALAWVGNVLFLVGHHRHPRLPGPAALPARHRAGAGQRLGAGALPA